MQSPLQLLILKLTIALQHVLMFYIIIVYNAYNLLFQFINALAKGNLWPFGIYCATFCAFIGNHFKITS